MTNPFGQFSAPQATPAAAAPAGPFSLEVPADPTWTPFEFGDTLEKDGYYCGTVVGEANHEKNGEVAGVWVTVALADEDVIGKKVKKLLQNPNTAKNKKFAVDQWRGLVQSIWGLDAARGAFSYRQGMFSGGPVYCKVESYTSDEGERRSSIQEFITADQYKSAAAAGPDKLRWPPKESAPKSAPGFGTGLPGGVPAAFGAPQPPAVQPMRPPQPPAAPANGQPQAAQPPPASAPTPPASAPTPPAAPQHPAAPPAPASTPGFPSFPGLKR